MRVAVLIGALLVAGCTTGQHGSVMDKVRYDFGVGEAPEGYVSGADKVFEKLPDVGATEIKRLNAEHRHGEVKFQQDGLHGKYYKETKVYEDYYPLDAQPNSRNSQGEGGGFIGYVEYSYSIYQSPRKNTRAEAAAETATVPTGDTGRETYRYKFTRGGNWDGGKGERSRR